MTEEIKSHISFTGSMQY